MFSQQGGTPPHYHRDVRAYLDDTLPGRWIGRRGAIEYPPWSPDQKHQDKTMEYLITSDPLLYPLVSTVLLTETHPNNIRATDPSYIPMSADIGGV
jgi:hypothetical protein